MCFKVNHYTHSNNALQMFTDACSQMHSLRRAHCKRNLVHSGKQAAYKLFGTKTVFLALKEFQDLCSDNIVLLGTENTQGCQT